MHQEHGPQFHLEANRLRMVRPILEAELIRLTHFLLVFQFSK